MSAKTDPWFAVNLSLLWPGLGQWAQGRSLAALLWGVGTAGLLALVLWSFLSPYGDVRWGSAGLGMGVLVWLFNLIDAHSPLGYPAQDQPVQPLDGEARIAGLSIQVASGPAGAISRRWLGLFLGQLLPGLGHLYCQQTIAGGLFLGFTILCLGLASTWPSLRLFVAIAAAAAAFHLSSLPIAAPKRLSQPQPQPQLILAIAILIARLGLLATPLVVEQFVEPFVVPSESMLPTLAVGDRILVYKGSPRQLHARDIIVFREPQANQRSRREKFFVKRLIGLSGDTLAIQSGRVIRNGQPLAEPYLQEPPGYEQALVQVPADRLFVLGDNRNHSYDSHVWGFLPQRNIVGRAYRISWPPERNRSLP